MNLKHLVLLTALSVSGISSNLNAQVLTYEAAEMIEMRVVDFMNDLNLSMDKEEEFVTILRNQFIAVIALSETDFSNKTKQSIIKVTTKERDQRMKELLSKEQYKVFQARVELRKALIADMAEQQSENQ